MTDWEDPLIPIPCSVAIWSSMEKMEEILLYMLQFMPEMA